MSARKTTEEIQSQLAHRGITFLRDVPAKGVRRGLFQCEKLHQWEATISSVCQSGNGCAECAGKKRLTVEDINLRLKDRGITLLSGYTNVNGKALFECPEGHRWETLVLNVLARSGCRECCTNVLLTKEIVNERLKEKGVWIVGEYKGINKKTEMQCNEGHIWIGRPAEALAGAKGCAKCAKILPLSLDEINTDLRPRGITLISGYTRSRNKARFRCDFGHEWEAFVNGVRFGNGCAVCSGHSIEAAKERFLSSVKERGFIALGEYEKLKNNVKLICPNNHTFFIAPYDFLTGRGCARCTGNGIKLEEKGFLYIYKIIYNEAEYCGFGITYNIKKRTSVHSTTFKKHNIEGTLVMIYEFKTGAEARFVEKAIKQSGITKRTKIDGFKTEITDYSNIEFIIEQSELNGGKIK